MKKSEAINTFALGLVMDINPLVAPNDGVCNALNATLITMNGNENVLQNDMGNGRVETAFLPEGYVPLGTTELGGIIYIVSYNPLNKKCLIGSFPSPERNISTDKISDLNLTLDNTDFKYDLKTDPQTGVQIGTQTGALVYYLKKELNEGLTFNPGDKFIVYGDTIDANFANLYDEASYTPDKMSTAKNYTLKLDIGTVTDTGKLVKFENLKLYNITYKDPTDPTKEILGKYHIFLYSGEGNLAPNLDEYRSLVSQPYNIFSSKISGSLVLIAELVQFNDFDVLLEHAFTISNGHKMYAPKATFTFSGDYPFIPKGVIGEISLTGTDQDVTSTFEYTIPDSDISAQLSKDNTFYEVKLEEILKDEVKPEEILENPVLKKIKEIAESGYFDRGERNGGYVIKYKFTPCMNWGPVSYLSVTGLIDLDKLGTGYIEINKWRYYNEENKCNLTWGLEIYEEEGHTVDKVIMKFTRFVTPTSTEFVIYKVNNKSSYFGVFYDVLPINEDYYRLTGRLKPNCLYLVEIQVYYKSTDEESPKPKTFYRWLYTNAVFNKHYTDTDDFQTLELDFTPNFKINYNNNIKSSNLSKAYGIIRKVVDGLTNEEKEISKEPISSLSAIQTKNDSSINGSLSVGLVKDYNTFYLEANKNAFEVTLNKNSVNCTSSSDIKYSDREDSDQDEFLKSGGEIVDSNKFSEYSINSDSFDKDVSDKLLNIPTNVIKIEGDAFNPEFKDNIYTFSLSYSSLHTVKAYCTKIISDLTYKGRFIPLAYDTTTFQEYNLEWNKDINKWTPFIVGLFGFKENSGDPGYGYIGGWNISGDSGPTIIQKGDNFDFHWTTDADIPPAQSEHGWSGTSMFFLHKWGGDYVDNITNYSNPGAPQNNANVYSAPYDKTGLINRVLLSLKSNKGDGFYYPINCSAFYSSDTKMTKTSDIFNIEKFCNLFNDFALYLNNIYRYDLEGTNQLCIIPEFIYWMENCKYSLSMSLNVKSKNALDKNSIYLMLDKGKLKLSEIITLLKNIKYLEDKGYPTLEKNISSKIQNIEKSFTINIVDSNNISGIEMRNYMLDCMKATLSSAIMDYDGAKILATTNILANNKYLYMRNDIDGNPSIALATKFIPKKIHYTKNGSNIITSVDTSNSPWIDENLFNILELNLNKYFTLDDNNMLVLKDPRSSEHKFIRYSGNDRGIIDGYLNLCILYKYKSY